MKAYWSKSRKLQHVYTCIAKFSPAKITPFTVFIWQLHLPVRFARPARGMDNEAWLSIILHPLLRVNDMLDFIYTGFVVELKLKARENDKMKIQAHSGIRTHNLPMRSPKMLPLFIVFVFLSYTFYCNCGCNYSLKNKF